MTPTHTQLEVSRTIRADRERVFDAWTDPAKIVKWWGAGGVTCPEAEMDVAAGGTYRIANLTPSGETMWISGRFSRVEPPALLTYSWAMEPIDENTQHSEVEVSFDETPDGTLVTVVQTRIASPEAREAHLGGWIGCLEGLEALLEAEA